MKLAAGDVVGGRYRLDRQLGEGGMGAVWAATHTVTNRAVALKVLLGRGGEDAALRERLLREARAVCAIMHPNVVPVHDVLELDGGAPALVMDLLVGESLRTRLDREGRLPADEVMRIAIDVLSALEAAHARGIIHRDLKPDNVFLARGPGGQASEVKVLDFGIAKVTTLGEGEGDAEAAALTRTDAMLGTPYYMAPEQVFGEKDIDARSDLWAMGVLMYECLAGEKPTEGANLGQIFKIVTVGPMVPLAEKAPFVPAALAALVMKCLARPRGERPASAEDLREALERVRAGGTMDGATVPVEARPVAGPVPLESVAASPRARRWPLAAAAGGLAIVAGVAGLVTMRATPRPPPSQTSAASSSWGPTAPLMRSAHEPPPLPPPSAGSAFARSANAVDGERPAASASASAPRRTAGKVAAPAANPESKPAHDERAAGKVVVTPPF